MDGNRTTENLPVRLYGRPRLRAKTGCITCRVRRKKCSEQRPKCDGCLRLSLECTWPKDVPARHAMAVGPSRPRRAVDMPAQIAGPVSDARLRPKPILPASMAYRPTAAEDRQALFRHFQEKFSVLVSPKYADGSKDNWNIVTVTAALRKEGCLEDLIYAIAAQHLSNESTRFDRMATEYYVSAMSRLGGMVARREIEGSEDWLLCMVILFPVFEGWRQSSTSNLSTHVNGLFQVLRLRVSRAMHAGRELRTLDHILAKVVLFTTSIVALYVDLDMKLVEDVFKTASYAIQGPTIWGPLVLDRSPVMMARSALFLAIVRISQLCRRAPLLPAEQGEVDAAAREFEAASAPIELALASGAGVVARTEMLPPNLYAVTTGIMLYKLQHPEADAADEQVQRRVQKAVRILRQLPSPFVPSHHLSWPIYVVGCAAVRPADRAYLLWMLDTLSNCGDLKRAARALEANWASPDGVPSGLDMLLHRRSSLYL